MTDVMPEMIYIPGAPELLWMVHEDEEHGTRIMLDALTLLENLRYDIARRPDGPEKTGAMYLVMTLALNIDKLTKEAKAEIESAQENSVSV